MRPLRRLNPRILSIPTALALGALLIAGALSGAHRAWAENPTPPAPKPNILMIVTDDQARWSIGAYGNREARTPNLDRLAREGAKFTRAFAATPVCSPSRVSMLAGLYGTQAGVTDWISPEEAHAGVGLPESVATWPEVLQSHGYRTALIGKWHLGEQPRFHPSKHGFDHFFGFLHGEHEPWDPTVEIGGHPRKLQGPLADLLADETLRFIRENQERPFAILVHFNAPHIPYKPMPEVDSAPFKALDPTIPTTPGLNAAQIKALHRDYYAAVHSIDRNVGRLLEGLDQAKLSGRTIVLMTSDHGYNIGHHGLHGKGNGVWIAGGVKGPKVPNMFDTSVAIPLFVRWPGVVEPGSEIGELVSNLDFSVTLPALLGLAPPGGAAPSQGMDFSPLLHGKKPLIRRDAVFGQYDLHNDGLAHLRMIRATDFKLIRHYGSRQMDELYDLRNDPEEADNLYDRPEHRDTRDRLQQRLTEWMKSIDDPVLKEAGSP